MQTTGDVLPSIEISRETSDRHHGGSFGGSRDEYDGVATAAVTPSSRIKVAGGRGILRVGSTGFSTGKLPSMSSLTHIFGGIVDGRGVGDGEGPILSEDETSFLHAVGDGNLEATKAVLKGQINVNVKNPHGATALYSATDKGHSTIEWVQTRMMHGDTPLIRAAANRFPSIVQLLLNAHDINVNLPNEPYKDTPLICASQYGFLEIVELLLHTPGIAINHVDRNGWSPLFRASEKNHFAVVACLLNAPDIDVNLANGSGNTPLIYACRDGFTEIVQLLLNTPGINVNQADQMDGLTPLIRASHKKSTDMDTTIVQLLLDAPGIDVNQADRRGWTPLLLASHNGHSAIVKLLLQAPHIDINKGDKYGDTALHMVTKKSKFDVLVDFLNHGADVSIKNKQGKTFFDLMSAAKDKLKILTMIKLNLSLVEAHANALWFVIVQEDGSSDVALFAKLLALVEALVSSYPTLADADDADGRAAEDVASKPMKWIMQSVLLWHGRYRITDLRPEHISATCYVFKAVDEHTIEIETQQPLKVALKLMRLKSQFLRELSARDKGFNPDHIMHTKLSYRYVDIYPDHIMHVLQHIRPNQANKDVYRSNVVYTKSSYRYVDNVLLETVYCLRPEDRTQLEPHYRCSKHKHVLSLNAGSNNKICNVCNVRLSMFGFGLSFKVFTCSPCNFGICETCFDNDNEQQEFTPGSTWILTIQDGKDQPEMQLARSIEPTAQVSDAVFSNIKVKEAEDGTVIVFDV